MPTRALSDRLLRSLKAPVDGSRVDYWDERLPGFGVRVSDTGRRTFFVRYRNDDGKRRRKTLGTFPATTLADARKDALGYLGDVARGEDPVEEERRKGMTFRRFAEDVYLEKYAKPRKRSWRDDLQKLNKDILPRIGDLPVDEVRRPHLVEILDHIAGRGSPVQARRTKALLSKVFKFALERGEIEESPAHGLPGIIQERARRRVLSNEELAALWWALSEEGPVVAAAFRVLILTGQRVSEVLGMSRDEMETGWWTLPPERTKNRLEHRLPLSPQVEAVLEELGRFSQADTGPWVFPSRMKRRKRQEDASPHRTKGSERQPLRWINKAVDRLRERTGIHDFRPHDLRRTMATRISELGFPRLVLMRVLNHKDPTVTGIYDRNAYDPEAREALNAWGEEVSRIVWASILGALAHQATEPVPTTTEEAPRVRKRRKPERPFQRAHVEPSEA